MPRGGEGRWRGRERKNTTFVKIHLRSSGQRVGPEHNVDEREREVQRREENAQIVNIGLGSNHVGTVPNQRDEEIINDDVKVRGKGTQ